MAAGTFLPSLRSSSQSQTPLFSHAKWPCRGSQKKPRFLQKMDQNTLTLEVSFSKITNEKTKFVFSGAFSYHYSVQSTNRSRGLRDISIRALTWKEAKVGKLQLALSTY